MKNIMLFVFLFLSFHLQSQPPAPDFTVTDTDGVVHNLYEDYLNQGTTVVLKIFFVACPPCNAVAPSVQDLYEDWGEGQYDVEFMELTNRFTDDDADVAGFKAQHGLTFPSISFDGGSIDVVDILTSGPWGPFFGTPSFYVIAPDGEVFSGLNFAAVNSAIEASGATGEGGGGGGELTTAFSWFVENASSPGTSVIVNTHLVDAQDQSNAIPIDLTDYATIESILEDYPNVSNPAIAISKDDNPLGGVSGLDLVLITKHILGIEPFDQNYKVLASDINQNGSVSGVDLSLLTKVILGIDPFPAGSWIFDPPLIELNVDPGNTVELNAVGIKLGDVN